MCLPQLPKKELSSDMAAFGELLGKSGVLKVFAMIP